VPCDKSCIHVSDSGLPCSKKGATREAISKQEGGV